MDSRRIRLYAAALSLSLMLAGLNGRAAAKAAAFDPLPIDDSPGLPAPQEYYLPDGVGYEDESLSVRIEKTRAYDTDILLAYVTVADASQIRTAMAGRYGSTRVVLPRVLSERMNAVFAVNGDFFNYRPTGYLVRQGELYRDRPDKAYDLLIIDDHGDFTVIQDPTEEKIRGFTGTIVNTFNFGPALILDGEKVLPVKIFDGGTMKKTQRMAACQTGPLSYLFVATEGPENKGSLGLTLEELIDFLAGLGGIRTAYNLDGGSSSSMVLGGEKINALSARKTRSVCDILYFSTLVTGSRAAADTAESSAQGQADGPAFGSGAGRKRASSSAEETGE